MSTFGKRASEMLQRARRDPDAVPAPILELVLENVSSLRPKSGAPEPLAIEVRAIAKTSDARIRAAAVRALGALHDERSKDYPAPLSPTSQEDPRVRRNAAEALRIVAGEDCVEPPARGQRGAPADDHRAAPARRAQAAPRACRSCARLPKTHYNSWFRREARKAITAIEGQAGLETLENEATGGAAEG